MAGMFDDLIPQQQAALPPSGGGMFDDLVPKKTGAGDPNFIIPAPGGMDAAFQQFEQQPAAPEADKRRMEDLASAYRVAEPGRGQAVDQRVQNLQKTTNPYLNATWQGLTSGFGDEAGAALRTGLGQGQGYDENLAIERELLRRQRREAPWAMAGAEVVGAALPAMLTGGATVAARAGQAPGLIKRAVDAAKSGAIWGGLYGFGTGEGLEGRAESALKGGAIGTGAGAILGPLMPAGRTAAMTPGQEAALAAERQGVALPRAAASDSMTVQRTGQAVANVPIAGNALKRASEGAIRQTGEAAERVAGEFGGTAGAATAESAGATARAGLERYVGVTTKGRVEKLYDSVDNLVNPQTTTPLQETGSIVGKIQARRQAAGLRGDGSAVDTVLEAVNRPQGLTYEGVKTLRTRVGEMLEQGILPADISQAELRQIYGALSSDLRSSVQAGGGQKALAAFERANTYNRLVSERRENLARLFKANSDEGVYERIARAAGSTSTADAKLLSQARKALPPNEWNEVASAVVGRMGRAPDGAFSAERFITAYGKLSSAGKDMLFRSTGRGDLANALEDIATISGRFKELQRFANPSGTAQNIVGFVQATRAMADPVSVAGEMLGGAVLSRVLASPATARSMARWARAYEAAVRTPARSAIASAQAASRRFASDIARELGLTQYTDQIGRALQGAIANTPADDRVEGPRPRGE